MVNLPTVTSGNTTITTFSRILGTYTVDSPGPLLVCIGGIHGNEPAGVFALQTVLKKLYTRKPKFKGEIVALAGNLSALQQGCRYINKDLNRLWSPAYLRSLKHGERKETTVTEDKEQEELLNTIETTLTRKRGPVIFLDLHTTSAASAPFALISDTLANRKLAGNLGAPIILGLEESVDGTLLNYINELGYTAFGFEAGQNESPISVDIHEAVVWIILYASGCLDKQDIPELEHCFKILAENTKDLPGFLELKYRHAISEGDGFVMQPGYVNFQKLNPGEVIAHDRKGAIQVKEDGRMFMPLYQKQGDDGFFLVKDVKPFWLNLSAIVRRLRLDLLLSCLPGISRDPNHSDTLIINTGIARWYVLEICHLLGFRKYSQEKGELKVSRRRQHLNYGG